MTGLLQDALARVARLLESLEDGDPGLAALIGADLEDDLRAAIVAAEREGVDAA